MRPRAELVSTTSRRPDTPVVSKPPVFIPSPHLRPPLPVPDAGPHALPHLGDRRLPGSGAAVSWPSTVVRAVPVAAVDIRSAAVGEADLEPVVVPLVQVVALRGAQGGALVVVVVVVVMAGVGAI